MLAWPTMVARVYRDQNVSSAGTSSPRPRVATHEVLVRSRSPYSRSCRAGSGARCRRENGHVNVAVLLLAGSALLVLVPLGAAAASKGYRRLDGSPRPEPSRRQADRVLVVFLGLLIGLALALG